MPQWKIIQPNTPEHWSTYYDLRFKVLRQAWHQPLGSEKADDDAQSLHGMILDENGKALAVARIHQVSDHQAQIRFMAVHPDYQGKGLGKAVLQFVELLGKKNYPDITEFCLQARENAVSFYSSNNYFTEAKTFLLFGEIQHYLMVKKI
jgi:predicted GNAT family N-acyltransferase